MLAASRPSLQAGSREHLLAEWDAVKNKEENGLTPADVSEGSNAKVFWLCKSGCSNCHLRHSYQAVVKRRALEG